MEKRIRVIKDDYAKSKGYDDYVDMIIKLTEKNNSIGIILVHTRIENLILKEIANENKR